MTEREFNLSERAEALGMELRWDNDGCYWLDYYGCPEVGPLDLDEVEAHIVVGEKGLSWGQFEDGGWDQFVDGVRAQK